MIRPERFRRITGVLDRRQPDLTVLMERVNKPHNLSAILRNCDAVGVLEVHAVPPDSGLPRHRDTAAGAQKWIRIHEHADGATAMYALQDSGFQVVAAHPSERSVDYRDLDYTRPTALLMGAELFGVSEEALNLSDQTIRIPMAGMTRSLNVSVATALVLYEAYRQREQAGFYERCRIEPDTKVRLAFEWAYPELARRLRGRGIPYPELDEDGRILGSLDALRLGPEQPSD